MTWLAPMYTPRGKRARLGFLAVLALVAGAPAGASAQCAAVTRSALQAVEGDSAAAMAARMDARLRRSPGDRDARLVRATIERFLYRYPAADSDFAMLATARDTEEVARCALLGAGWAADTRGVPLRADSLLSHALTLARAAHDSSITADAYVGLTIIRAAARGVSVGLALLDSADRFAPASALDIRAEAAARRSLLYAVSGDTRANAEVQRGLALARRAHDRRAEARLLRSLASALHIGGANDSSLVVLARTAQLEREARDHSTLAETLLRSAEIYSDRGQLGRVRELVTEARTEATISGNLFALGAADLGVAVVALAVRDYGTADARIADARHLAVALHDSGSLSPVLIDETELALMRGELAHAREIALADRAIHHQLRDLQGELQDVRALIATERRAGNFPAAQHWIDVAASIGAQMHTPTEIDYDRATVAFAAGDDRAAVRFARRYLTAVDTAGHATRHAAGELLGASLARLGSLDEARDALDRAESELDAWRAASNDPGLRAYAFEVWTHEGELGLSPAAEALASLARAGRAGDAFALAERRRARELSDALVRAAALSVDTSRTRVRVDPLARGGATLSADSMRAAITDDSTALLEYVTGTNGAPTTLLVVTRRGVRGVVLLAADSVAAPIARFGMLLQSGAPASALASSLAAQLVLPGLATLPASVRRLVVVADGPLHWLPFDALRDGAGHYLVERYRISMVPSAAVAVALRRRPADRAVRSGRVLALGASHFSPLDSLPPLPSAAAEARDVAGFGRASTLRTGDAASAQFVRATPLDSFELIHVAAHAIVDEESANRTRLVLSAPPDQSGALDAAEIAQLRLGAHLVVLSACRTAGGVLIEGEGVQGLTAPLLRAGAGAVIATRWPTGDREAAQFVHEMYVALAGGASAADALRTAQLRAIRRGDAPSTWAAFTLIGDPDVHIALEREPHSMIDTRAIAVAIGAVLLAAIVVVVAGRARRRSPATRSVEPTARR